MPDRRHLPHGRLRARWLTALLLAAGVAASSAPVDARAESPAAVGNQQLRVLWRAQMATPAAMAWKPREHGGVALSPHGSWLFAASATGLRGYISQTGEERWSVATTERVDSQPVVQDGGVYAVTRAGTVYAVDARTGKSLWAEPARLQAAVQAPIAADNKLVYVSADPGAVVALDRATGKPMWRYNAEVTRDFLIEGQSGVLPVNSLVYVGLPGGKLVALGARDGGLTWQVDLSRPGRSPYADVDSTPVLVPAGTHKTTQPGDDWLLASSHSGGLYALHAADGAQVWRVELEGVAQPLVHGNRVYVIANPGTLYTLDLDTGTILASQKLPGNPSGKLAWSDAGDGTLLVPMEQGLDLVRASTGLGMSRALLEWGFTATPQVSGADVYAVSNGGVLYALRLDAPVGDTRGF